MTGSRSSSVSASSVTRLPFVWKRSICWGESATSSSPYAVLSLPRRLFDLSASPAVRERLQKAGFRYVGEVTVGGSTSSSPDGTAVDVLEAHAPWAGDAPRQAQQNRDLQGLPVLPLPFFILMKLQSGRT